MHKQWFNLRMSILLAFMLKELSCHASCDICHNQLEFFDYHLVELGNIPVLYRNDDICSHQYQYRAKIFIPGNRYTVEYRYAV